MLADKLKSLRKTRKWTVIQLAQKADVSRALISKYEKNEAKPSPRTLKKIADAFGVPMSTFMPKAISKDGQSGKGTIATKLYNARLQKGYSLAALENISGIYASTIQRYENGSVPIRKNLARLAKALDLPLQYFYQDGPNGSTNMADLPFEKKLKQVKWFSPAEKQLIETLIDQVLEKHNYLDELNVAYNDPKRTR